MQLRKTSNGAFKALGAVAMSAMLLSSTAFAQEAPEERLPYSETPEALIAEQQAPENDRLLLPNIETYIDGTIEAQRAMEEIPAVSVSIVQGGELIFSKGYGYADLESKKPVDPATSLFRIGSASKLFTWIAVMQLYEQGLVDLDTDVNEYLDFRIPDTFDAPITLNHILTHTAGFEDGGLGYLIHSYPDMGPELAEAMEIYIPERLNPPGRVSSYSNYATALAGLIVQNVTGTPFNDYVRETIFEPLGMQHTTFEEPLPEHLQEHMTKGYTRKLGVFEEEPYEIINSFGPAGAVASSAHDMARFMLANLNDGELDGNRFLNPETTQLMHSQLFTGDERIPGMAHGYYENVVNGYRLIGHGGNTFQFHTAMMVDKEQDLGIFVSYMTTTSRHARNTFIQQIYDHYFPQEIDEIEPPTDFAERADDYAGSYIFWRRNESTVEKAFGLMNSGVQVAPTEQNTLLVNGPFGARQFVEIDDHLFRQVDGSEVIAFSNTGGGDQIDTFYYGSLPFMALQRAPAMRSSFYRAILPAVSLLLMLQVVITWFYRRKNFKARSASDSKLFYGSLFMSIAHLLFVVIGVTVFTIYGTSLYSNIPLAFKAMFILPIIALLLTLYALYTYVKRFLDAQKGAGTDKKGAAAVISHIYFGFVVAAGLYMSFFYYYWKMLGWQMHG